MDERHGGTEDLLRLAKEAMPEDETRPDAIVSEANIQYDPGRQMWRISDKANPGSRTYDVVGFVSRFDKFGAKLNHKDVESRVQQGSYVVELREVIGREPGKPLYEAKFTTTNSDPLDIPPDPSLAIPDDFLLKNRPQTPESFDDSESGTV